MTRRCLLKKERKEKERKGKERKEKKRHQVSVNVIRGSAPRGRVQVSSVLQEI